MCYSLQTEEQGALTLQFFCPFLCYEVLLSALPAISTRSDPSTATTSELTLNPLTPTPKTIFAKNPPTKAPTIPKTIAPRIPP